MNEFNGIEFIEEYTLDFLEPYKDQELRLWKTLMQKELLNLFLEQMKLFVREMMFWENIGNEDTRKVKCVVQSISSTTHSYTIQPTISADAKLLSPLYLVFLKKLHLLNLFIFNHFQT